MVSSPQKLLQYNQRGRDKNKLQQRSNKWLKLSLLLKTNNHRPWLKTYTTIYLLLRLSIAADGTFITHKFMPQLSAWMFGESPAQGNYYLAHFEEVLVRKWCVSIKLLACCHGFWVCTPKQGLSASLRTLLSQSKKIWWKGIFAFLSVSFQEGPSNMGQKKGKVRNLARGPQKTQG